MMTKKEYQAALRRDLATFIHRTFLTVVPGEVYMRNWHIDAIAWHLQEVAAGRNNRLIITIPPRHLKSIAVSVAFSAWLLGLDPTRKIICVGYAHELAVKFGFDTRAVMASEWYREIFSGTRIHPHKDTQHEFATTRRGFRLTTSVGGALTGRGGNMIIIDDPHKAEEALSQTKREGVIAWFKNTLLTRLDSKREDSIVLIQQRLHEEDLAGHLLETGEWTHLNIPAIAEEAQRIQIGENQFKDREGGDVLHPERESPETLEKIKNELGSYTFAAQYQQRPAPLGGGLVKWEWFNNFDVPPKRGPGDEIILSLDAATKAEASNDWSVCTVWLLQNYNFYLLQLSREKLEFPELKKWIVRLAENFEANAVLIEDAGAGSSLIQDLRQGTAICVIEIFPKDDKATRLMAASPFIEAGRVFLPREAHWLADFQREVVTFPKGKHDDQVDSLSQFLNWARENRSKSNGTIECVRSFFGSRDSWGNLLPLVEGEEAPPPPGSSWN